MDEFANYVRTTRMANPTMPNEQVLAKAYEAACWANPQVRTKMQREVDEQSRKAEAERVKRAKVAGSSINGGPSSQRSATQPQPQSTLRAELEQAFAAAAT